MVVGVSGSSFRRVFEDIIEGNWFLGGIVGSVKWYFKLKKE